MSTKKAVDTLSLRFLTGTLATFLMCAPASQADTKKAAVPAPAAKPAAPAPKTAPAKPPASVPGRPGAARPSPTTSNPHPVANTRSVTTNQPRPPVAQTSVSRVPRTNQTVLPNGNKLSTRTDGRVADLHVPNRSMDIHHGLSGDRRVVVAQRDGGRIVAERGRPSFVEHPYRFGNQNFGHRTYYYNGRVYDHYYRQYPYRGVIVEGYAPPVYYSRYYYGWAYNPWPAPAYYAWGWQGQPWYGYYGNYFTPYPVYPSASAWLTDYTISQSLTESYEAGQQSGLRPATPQDAAALTPQVKDMVSQEVQRQIALENEEADKTAKNQEIDPAMSGVGRILTDGVQHVFIAGRSIDVVDATGVECAVTEGDVLQLPAPPPGAATAADLNVLASKGDPDCHPGSVISVALDEIQEMQNHMREVVDQGLAAMKDQKGGLPPIPPSAQAPVVKAAFAAAAPPPDAQASQEIEQQVRDADKAETGLLGATPSAAPGQPKQISLGMKPEQVTASFGPPTSIRDLGNKKIYVYSDMKVTFTNGKVSGID